MLKSFSTKFNIATTHIASKLFPLGFDVSDDAPSSLAELMASFASGRHTVWRGASEATIFGGPEAAEVNWAFRAWHDWHHWHGKHALDLNGEAAVARGQITDVFKLFGQRDAYVFADLILEEVLGQAAYKAATGAFPENQRAFARDFLRPTYDLVMP